MGDQIPETAERCCERSSPAAHVYAAQPWIAEPTRAGWWWWSEADKPVMLTPLCYIREGKAEVIGIGFFFEDYGKWMLCTVAGGLWAGPIERPPMSIAIAVRGAGQSCAPLPGCVASDWLIGRKMFLRKYRRQNGLCALCSLPFAPQVLTRDHIIPRSRGGGTQWDNIQLACEPCNSAKGNR